MSGSSDMFPDAAVEYLLMRALLQVGARVRFAGEKQARWHVRAVSDRFVICTKVMFGRTYYTVLDFDLGVRGPDSQVGGAGYMNDEQIADAMTRLNDPNDFLSVSERPGRCVTLDIEEIRS